MLIWYSQEARSYALLVFFCAASLLFFARALRTRDGRDLALWALASALALCSHYFAVFAVGIEALWLLVALRSRWRAVLPAVGGVAIVGLALIPLISAQVNPTHIGWIDHSLLSTRLFQTGVSFLVGETGHVIAEPPRERYALLPAILIGVGLPARRRSGVEDGAARGAARRGDRAGRGCPRGAGRGDRQGLRGRAQPAARPGAARGRGRDRLRHRPSPPPRPAARGRPLRLLDRPSTSTSPRRRTCSAPTFAASPRGWGRRAGRGRSSPGSSPPIRSASTCTTARCGSTAARCRCARST